MRWSASSKVRPLSMVESRCIAPKPRRRPGMPDGVMRTGCGGVRLPLEERFRVEGICARRHELDGGDS